MPVVWDGDGSLSDTWRVQENLVQLLRDIRQRSALRHLPTVRMACTWHRIIFLEVQVPVPYFPGGIRDSNPNEPELVDYQVGVKGPTGQIAAVVATDVPNQLRTFETDLLRRVRQLDIAIPPGDAIASLLQRADDVLGLCAFAHGEWIRIHPFVNGNGRIARIWANWCALRYGLPAFVRLRPRPQGNGYLLAAEQSMYGRHMYMQIEFTRMLTSYYSEGVAIPRVEIV